MPKPKPKLGMGMLYSALSLSLSCTALHCTLSSISHLLPKTHAGQPKVNLITTQAKSRPPSDHTFT